MAKAMHGGVRAGAGRKTLFPGKRAKGRGFMIQLTQVAYDAAMQKAEDLTKRKPKIAAAVGVKRVSVSDAIEFLIRRGMKISMEE